MLLMVLRAFPVIQVVYFEMMEMELTHRYRMSWYFFGGGVQRQDNQTGTFTTSLHVHWEGKQLSSVLLVPWGLHGHIYFTPSALLMEVTGPLQRRRNSVGCFNTALMRNQTRLGHIGQFGLPKKAGGCFMKVGRNEYTASMMSNAGPVGYSPRDRS